MDGFDTVAPAKRDICTLAAESAFSPTQRLRDTCLFKNSPCPVHAQSRVAGIRVCRMKSPLRARSRQLTAGRNRSPDRSAPKKQAPRQFRARTQCPDPRSLVSVTLYHAQLLKGTRNTNGKIPH